MAVTVFAQPDGRRHRRLPLGHSRRPILDLYARFRAQLSDHRLLPLAGCPPVSLDGKELRRPHLKGKSVIGDGSAIDAEVIVSAVRKRGFSTGVYACRR